MSVPSLALDPAQGAIEAANDRRSDVDAKQLQIAAFLQEMGCDGLLVMHQANLAWLTSGAIARNIIDPEEFPALYMTAAQRWLLCSNVDSQRLFDEELNQMGFMLKEWPWHWGRDQLLGDLVQNKRVVCDLPFRDTKTAGDRFRAMRRTLTPYEQACYRQLGQQLAHALEATCRGANPGETERELAGQVAHRLLRRGAIPVALSVIGDGRSRRYRRAGYTMNPVRSYAVVSATVRKYGLHATASRTFSFGPPDDPFKQEHMTASKIAATYIASTWPDAVPYEIFNSGKRVYQLTDHEFEWHRAQQGYVTGHMPVEMNLTPDTADLIKSCWAVTWQPSVGAAISSDTFLITDSGPHLLTPIEEWPLINVRILGNEFPRHGILER